MAQEERERETAGSRHMPSLAGVILVNVATLSWAGNIALGRLVRAEIGPLALSATRFLIAAPIFLFLLSRRPAQERRLGRDAPLLLAMALCGVSLFAPTLYLALRFTTASNATLINGLGPLVTGFLAMVLIQEPMSRRQAAGALAALLGVVVLISGGSPTFLNRMAFNVGDLIMIAAIILWSLYSVLSRKATRRRSSLSATAFSVFLGLPLLLLAGGWEINVLPVAASMNLWPILLYMGIAPTVIGFLAWNEGVRRLGSSGAMVFYNTLPVYGSLLGHFFLQETMGLAQVAGGALIIGGGLWAARGHSSNSVAEMASQPR
jgi:drug/metabolite transporter (DMT)-like permease